MANPQQEEVMRALAKGIEEGLEMVYGRHTGFYLVAIPFGDGSDGVSDYIGNIDRTDAIAALRATADRLEKNQTIPATQGEA